jgi:hypothetical protein
LVLAQFMAIAALEDGKYGQAFPFLGGSGRENEIAEIQALADANIEEFSFLGKPQASLSS